MITILKSKRAMAFPMTVAIVLCIILILSGIAEYMRLLLIAQGVRDSMNSAVISVVNDNYANVYHGVREGGAYAYLPDEEAFTESIDYGDIYERMAKLLGLYKSGSSFEKRDDSDCLEFRIYDLSVKITNAPFAKSDEAGQRFEAESEITLEVPVRFAGNLLPPLEVRLHGTAGFTPRF